MKKVVFLIPLILAVMLIAGCTAPNTTDSQQNNITTNNTTSKIVEEKKEITGAQDLALSLTDLPDSWEISTRGERTKSDVSSYGISLGWTEGYNIVFRKVESKDVSIYQDVSVYPKENVSHVLDISKAMVKLFTEGINGTTVNWDTDQYGVKYRIEELKKIDLGDDSISMKYIYENDRVSYVLEFIKDKYYERFSGYDYELIKELAKKAETKIG